MKAYQRIAIPREGLNDSEELELSDLTSNTEIYNVICMTIEELREVFQAGYNRSNDEWDGNFNQHAVNQPDFETYLTSKNIQI